MDTKICKDCGERKSLEDFYKHKQMADGRLNSCKECRKAYVRGHYRETIEDRKAYERSRAMLPHRIEARKRYEQTDAGKASLSRAKRKWLENNADKRASHVLLNNAVRDGRIVKPDTCSQCGASGRVHGHHKDYAKPLEVLWVCAACHTKIHNH